MASPHDVYLLGHRLYNAALRGDQCQVALALDQGAAIDWHSTNYNLRLDTALPAAASNGHAPVVRLLLDRQASIGAVDGENERPLHIAALAGQEPVVRLLLDRRASIDATDNFSKQPLYYAVREGHESVVRLLLGQRADPSIERAWRGVTLLSGERCLSERTHKERRGEERRGEERRGEGEVSVARLDRGASMP